MPRPMLQSLRSLVDNISHSPPLTSKDSSRLLNALTASFRKHLDEAHPPFTEPQVPNPASVPSSRRTSPGVAHSSPAAADRHLASILTNPLLNNADVKARKQFESALRQPGVNPIVFFEDFQARHQATLPLARLCLQYFWRSIEQMSADDRLRVINGQRPGHRMLSWLCLDESNFRADFQTQKGFQKLLVYFLLAEGGDEILWARLRLDLTLHNDTQSSARQMTQDWRARLLYNMVQIKLGRHPFLGLNRDHDADDGLEVCLKAIELQSHSTFPRAHIPMKPACWLLVNCKHHSHGPLHISRTDVHNYAQFLNFLEKKASTSADTSWQLIFLKARMNHPEFRDPTPGLQLLVSLRDPHGADAQRLALSMPAQTVTLRRAWFQYFVDCIECLQERGQTTEAPHYFADVETSFPEFKKELESIRSAATEKRRKRSPVEIESMVADIRALPGFG